MSYIAIAVTAVSAGLSVYQATQQNQAIKRSIKSQRQAATVQTRQVQEQARVRAQQRLADLRRTQGALRVAGAAAGVGTGSSYAQLEDAAAMGAQLDLGNVGRNATNNITAISSDAAARIAQLNASRVNPLLAGLAGGMQGYAAGSSMSGAAAAPTADAGGLDPAFNMNSAAPISQPPAQINRYELPVQGLA